MVEKADLNLSPYERRREGHDPERDHQDSPEFTQGGRHLLITSKPRGYLVIL